MGTVPVANVTKQFKIKQNDSISQRRQGKKAGITPD
jgi:hypothetical protein